MDIQRTQLSVLCEIKHSMNISGQFRSGGETDIQALVEYPGDVGRRYFLFLDWWPRDGYGKTTFEKDVRQLEERIGEAARRVDVAYLPMREKLTLYVKLASNLRMGNIRLVSCTYILKRHGRLGGESLYDWS